MFFFNYGAVKLFQTENSIPYLTSIKESLAATIFSYILVFVAVIVL